MTERQESSDEQPIGWGDEPDPEGRDGERDRDLERLLADRPPHHDRD